MYVHIHMVSVAYHKLYNINRTTSVYSYQGCIFTKAREHPSKIVNSLKNTEFFFDRIHCTILHSGPIVVLNHTSVSYSAILYQEFSTYKMVCERTYIHTYTIYTCAWVLESYSAHVKNTIRQYRL